MTKIALVHEFLTQLGGAERVLQSLHELFSDAPVYTLVYDKEKTLGQFEDWDIRPSFIQNLPFGVKKYKSYLPLMPRAIENFDFAHYDLVLSDSSAFAKGVITKKPTVHICYCHTPTRYLWESMDEYVANLKYPALVRKAAKFYLKNFLKKWDWRAAQRPDFFIANSRTVQERIKKYYRRDSVVIYPPVDTDFFTVSAESVIPDLIRDPVPKEYFLTASRLEPYKRIDLVIETFNKLDLSLKVAGAGSQFLNLKSKIKNRKIEFLGRVSDEQLRELYRGAKAFIFPALEDAGIMVLEALSCGTPVAGYSEGGAAEFIRDGGNGFLMKTQSITEILTIVKKLENHNFDRRKLRATALPYTKERFKRQILDILSSNTN